MSLFITFGVVAVGTGLWLWLLRRYDRVEPESTRHLVQVVILGGLASTIPAAFFNELFAGMLGMQYMSPEGMVESPVPAFAAFCLLIGLVEEGSKAVAAVHVTRRWGDLDEPVDAMIYAMSVGLGFAAFENLLYAIQYGNEVLLIRLLWPVLAHMAYAALWGYGLAKARFVHPEKNSAWVMAPSLALAMLVHAGVNYLLFTEGGYALLASLAVLMGLAVLAHRRLKALVAASPHLQPGECPACRHRNAPDAEQCARCGSALRRDMFGPCPCGEARIPVRAEACPECGQSVAGMGADRLS